MLSTTSLYVGSLDPDNIDIGQPLASGGSETNLHGANFNPTLTIEESEFTARRNPSSQQKSKSGKELKGGKILQAKTRKNVISPSVSLETRAKTNSGDLCGVENRMSQDVQEKVVLVQNQKVPEKSWMKQDF